MSIELRAIKPTNDEYRYFYPGYIYRDVIIKQIKHLIKDNKDWYKSMVTKEECEKIIGFFDKPIKIRKHSCSCCKCKKDFKLDESFIDFLKNCGGYRVNG